METLSIWIVEDDFTYKNLLVSYLALLGHSTRVFSTGEEFLAELDSTPDVVLLDHNLGDGMTGVEVLQKIQVSSPLTRVIYISGEEKASVVSETYRYGSMEYITKDSASLLRLKLILEKILSTKTEQVQTRKNRRTKLIVGLGIAVLLVAIYLITTQIPL